MVSRRHRASGNPLNLGLDDPMHQLFNFTREIFRGSPYIRWTVIAAVVVNLFVYALAFWSLHKVRQQFEEQTEVTTANLARTLDEDIAGLLDRVNASLVAVVSELEQQIAEKTIDPVRLSKFITVQQQKVLGNNDLRVTDTEGVVRYVSGSTLDVSASVEDRDFYQKLREDAHPDIAIGAPVIGRISGKMIMPVARRYNFPDGRFAGVVLSPIPLDYFISVFSSLNTGQHGAISLRNDRHGIIIRYPKGDTGDNVIGNDEISDTLHTLLLQQPEYGTYTAVAELDRIERTISYRKIGRFPLYVFVGQASWDYLVNWRKEALVVWGLVAAFTAISVFMTRQLHLRWLHERQATDLLQRSEECFSKAFHASPAPMSISDITTGRFIDVNEKVLQMIDRTREETIGFTSFELGLWADPQLRITLGEKVQKLGSVRDEPAQFVGKSGRAHDTLWSAEKITIAGKEAMLSLLFDITDRKKAEEEIRRLNDQLRHEAEILEQRVAERTAELVVARDRAEAADRIKSAFLATMSHELRTPLNSIIGFTGIMLQGLAGPLNDEQRKQMNMVQNSSRHLLSLINDILDISKIEAGQVNLAVEAVDLRASLEKMVKVIAPLADKKGLALRLDIDENVGPLLIDQRRMEQVILNLLSNAVKFTNTGHIRIVCRDENNCCVLSFTDTGIGILPEDLAGIFAPFHQIDTGLSRKCDGTGLGLSICKKILDLMGGSIEVESKKDAGSTFTVRVPKQPKELQALLAGRQLQ
jgi:PAS domain S-box-containing protein